MPVAVADGEHPEPANDEEPAKEMEFGDASLRIEVDAGSGGQVEDVDGSEDTNGAMGQHGTAKIVVAHGRHGTGKWPMGCVVGRRPSP
jgi:hypothetical protein